VTDKNFKPGDKVICTAGAWKDCKGIVANYILGDNVFEVKISHDPSHQYFPGEVIEVYIKHWQIDTGLVIKSNMTMMTKQEGPCQICKRMNDLDKNICWWCMNVPF